MSDSSYAAATRHRKPYSTTGRPPVLEIVDDDWAADTLGDDDVNCDAHEAAIASYLDEGDLDVDAVVVSTGHSNPGSNNSIERRKREEGRWNDLGLDNFNSTTATTAAGTDNRVQNNSSGTGTTGQSH